MRSFGDELCTCIIFVWRGGGEVWLGGGRLENASHEVSLGLVSSFEGGWSDGGLAQYEVPRPCILVLVLTMLPTQYAPTSPPP